MPKDYIPQGDSGLLEFADNFIEKTSGSEASFGLNAGDTTDLTSLRDEFRTAYEDNLDKQTAARASSEGKREKRKTFEARLRQAAQDVQSFSGTTDEMRADLRLTVRDDKLTDIGVPDTFPVGEIKQGAPLQHIVSFRDSELEGKGKPDGVQGAIIYCKIGGEATLNVDDYDYLATDTASPYLAVHEAQNAGQKAHYLMCWVNTKGEQGAFGSPVSATITG